MLDPKTARQLGTTPGSACRHIRVVPTTSTRRLCPDCGHQWAEAPLNPRAAAKRAEGRRT